MVESVIQIKNIIMIKVDASVKNIIIYVKKHYIQNLATHGSENGKYLVNIIDDSVITWDEIIEETNTVAFAKIFY